MVVTLRRRWWIVCSGLRGIVSSSILDGDGHLRPTQLACGGLGFGSVSDPSRQSSVKSVNKNKQYAGIWDKETMLDNDRS